MKRLLLTLILALAVTPAYAQQWDQVNGSMQVKSGPTAPLVIIDQTTAGQKIASFRSAGTEKCYIDVSGNLNCAGTLSLTSTITTYSNVATAGQGVDVIRAQATTGTVTNTGTASIATWTPGAADVEVEVGCRVNITVSTTHSFSCDVTYTDVSNAARTRVLEMFPITGTPLASGLMTNVVGAGDFASAVTRIGVKASTAITVRTSSGGTFTTVTYTASGTIKQVGP
jgi:hypothetical protein